ncbi:head completion/stabilization protein [Ralstonia pseudosolanacearum]|uniref:head completion/stabilization protein n=1 Tax=Ralstonia pseudosolanacearum TaxID=1310165 RepID=UPI001432CE71|nr:head completion/stabilization protein [Ralstonia pseudosolanacearum]NKA15557.1 head completion/stabilization protein [Ralstonia solanacearum]NKA51149.1 head completion/stabilization protein [Ralstonia solanacearum]UYR02730.1 head completion/stabilization protein [Ralstonia pseudosolanacearum]UYR11555.1 head completion/stabilization protein [Ralstonia pseudosolanacearum]
MSSFIAAAPVPTPAQPGGQPIGNDGFFPDIDVDQACAAMRLDGTVTPERLRAALVDAALSVNDELAAWKAQQLAAGFTELGAVPGQWIDGRSRHVHRYLRAVHCTAAAWLMERYRAFDATAAGDRKAESENSAVDDLRRDARWAVSDITGAARTTVELI